MKAVLYLGLDPSRYVTKKKIIHYPIISIRPEPFECCKESFKKLQNSTHTILTSRSAVNIFFNYALKANYTHSQLKKMNYIAIGKATANLISEKIGKDSFFPTNQCLEGIIELLSKNLISTNTFFYPHSKLSRPLLKNYFDENQLKYTECILYSSLTSLKKTLPWDEFDEIVFSSPSTVDAFFSHFNSPSSSYKLTSIGLVTQKHLEKMISLKTLN